MVNFLVIFEWLKLALEFKVSSTLLSMFLIASEISSAFDVGNMPLDDLTNKSSLKRIRNRLSAALADD